MVFNPQFKFSCQNLGVERNFFKWDGNVTQDIILSTFSWNLENILFSLKFYITNILKISSSKTKSHVTNGNARSPIWRSTNFVRIWKRWKQLRSKLFKSKRNLPWINIFLQHLTWLPIIQIGKPLKNMTVLSDGVVLPRFTVGQIEKKSQIYRGKLVDLISWGLSVWSFFKIFWQDRIL